MSYPIQYSLGDLNFNAKFVELERKAREFDTAWDDRIRETVPTAFVLDVLGALLGDVVSPFGTLGIQLVADDITNVPMSERLTEIALVARQTWDRRLLPIYLAALENRRKGILTMRVPYKALGNASNNFKSMIILTMFDYALGYKQFGEVMADKPAIANALGGAIRFYNTALKAVAAIYEFMAAAGRAAYESVAAIPRIIDTLITVTKWSAVGAVAYYLFFHKKKTPELGQAGT